MSRLPGAAQARERLAVWLACVMIGAAFLAGGASRADALSQPLVRLTAVAVIGAAILLVDRRAWERLRTGFLLLLVLAFAIAVQLVPLPPGIWTTMPGQGPVVEALRGIGLDQLWRPISLVPDGTVNSLLALLPVAATLLCVSLVPRPAMPILLVALIVGVIASGLLGALQVSSDAGYLYRITNPGSAVGLFANRNHQAMLLGVGLPLLAVWAVLPHGDPAYQRLRFWLALCASAAVYPLLLITGSRAGLALGAVATLFAAAILLSGAHWIARDSRERRRLLLLSLMPIGIAALGSLATIVLARDLALQRLLDGVGGELRVSILPLYWQMVRDFFPVGTGFGAFEAVYRMYEPRETLDPRYLNHAHFDWLQLVIEGGVLALAVVAAALLLFFLALVRVWRTPVREPIDLLGRAGSLVLLLLFAGSVGDYPLRTPLLATVATVAAAWLILAARRERPADAEKVRVGSPERLS